MNKSDAENLIRMLYAGLLVREPAEKELAEWTDTACSELPVPEIIARFIRSKEFVEKNRIKPFFHAGHYYSAVVDPETVRDYVPMHREASYTKIPGVSIDRKEMKEVFGILAQFMRSPSFPEEKSPHRRFYYNNSSFPYGDAITLRAMIMHHRPRLIMEIGSGHSSACILDVAEDARLENFSLVCIDPDASRLKNQLQPGDEKIVQIIEKPVQSVSIEEFSALGPGDILFIDSTHVMKTGSDVHYELFEILPSLSTGVVIHFHDIQYPFEYPNEWIFNANYSWNEIYALKAFLMYNDVFRITYWNGMMAKHEKDLLNSVNPLLTRNPGGSLWITKKRGAESERIPNGK